MRLAEPKKIGKLELKNSIIMGPMGNHFADIDQNVVEYFVRRAEGGAAMVLVNMAVTDRLENTSTTQVLTEENFPYFKELVDRCHAYGCKVCPQIMPGIGRIGAASKLYPVPISSSENTWLHDANVICHALTIEEIEYLLAETRRTVKLVIDAGVDAIEMHAYGGYLNDQFLTAAWNKRTDKYGGDMKGRATFLMEQFAIMKELGGEDFPVIVKFNPDHYYPQPGFRTMEEGLELAKYLEEQGVAALHVDAGCYENWNSVMPPLFYQEAVFQLKSAKAVKEVVSIPVITHGRLSNFSKAEAAIASGCCDIVSISRGLLADPDMPNKLFSGHPEDILPCISCNEACIGNVRRGVHVGCVLNPFTGFEAERSLKKAEEPKRVLVVGAGPSGCTAALMAKQAGHDVEIWERNGVIGGKTLAASSPYMKTDMNRLPQYFAIQLVKAGIPVKFFKTATHDSVKEHAPDVLIWAAGGNVVRPKSIPGIDRGNVYSCEDALKNLVPLGKRLVIVGGGQVGIEAAVHFDHMYHDVTVVEMADKMMPDPPFKSNEAVLREMMADGNGVYLTSTKLVEINEAGVIVETDGEKKQIECDTVLLAMGWSPDAQLGKQFEDICPVFTVGDSNQCRNIHAATTEAYEAVVRI